MRPSCPRRAITDTQSCWMRSWSLLDAPDGTDPAAAYQLDTARRVAQYAREIDRRGARLEEQDLDEAAELLGHRPASWREADAELERRAISAGVGRATRPLVRFLVRRSRRREALLGPALRELEGASAQAFFSFPRCQAESRLESRPKRAL